MVQSVRVSAARVDIRGDSDQLVRELRQANVAMRSQITRLRGLQTQAGLTNRAFGRLRNTFRGLIAPLAAGLTIYGFSRLISSAAEFGSTMIETSRQTGIFVEQLQTLDRVARGDGVQFTTVTRGLNNLRRQLQEAQRGVATSVDAFRTLGLSIDELASDTQINRLTALADAVQRLGVDASSGAIATILGARAGPQLAPILERGGAALQSQLLEERQFGVLDAFQAQDLKDLNQEFQNIGEAASSLGRQFSAELAPALTTIVAAITDGINFIRGAIFEDSPTRGGSQFVFEPERGFRLDEGDSQFRIDTLNDAIEQATMGILAFQLDPTTGANLTNLFSEYFDLLSQGREDLARLLLSYVNAENDFGISNENFNFALQRATDAFNDYNGLVEREFSRTQTRFREFDEGIRPGTFRFQQPTADVSQLPRLGPSLTEIAAVRNSLETVTTELRGLTADQIRALREEEALRGEVERIRIRILNAENANLTEAFTAFQTLRQQQQRFIDRFAPRGGATTLSAQTQINYTNALEEAERQRLEILREQEQQRQRDLREAAFQARLLAQETENIRLSILRQEQDALVQAFGQFQVLQRQQDRFTGRFAPRGGAPQTRANAEEVAAQESEEILQLQKDIRAEEIRRLEALRFSWGDLAEDLQFTVGSSFSTLAGTMVTDIDNAGDAWNRFVRSIQDSLLEQAFDPIGNAIGSIVGGLASGLGDYVGGQFGGTSDIPLPPTRPSLAGSPQTTVNNNISVTGSDEATVRRVINQSIPSITAASEGRISRNLQRPSTLRSQVRN